MHEARALAALEHTHIVKVYDAQLGPPSWLAMELLEGRSLEQEWGQRGPLAPARAVHLMLQCLSGLSAIHARGLVHKDLKPSNLFLVAPRTPQERLVILDFSAATRCDDPDARLTGRFELVGTPQYMAPEYIGGGAPTRAGDLYQAGLTLAEMLLGRPVVQAQSASECMARHSHGLLDLPDALREGPLGEVLGRALSVKPQERHESAESLRRALEGVLPGLAGQAPLEGTGGLVGGPARTTRPLWSLSAAGSLDEARVTDAAPLPAREDGASAVPTPAASEPEARTANLRRAPAAPSTAHLPRAPRRRGWRAWMAASVVVLGLSLALGAWMNSGGAQDASRPSKEGAATKKATKKAAKKKSLSRPLGHTTGKVLVSSDIPAKQPQALAHPKTKTSTSAP
jgi:hypothetical protein